MPNVTPQDEYFARLEEQIRDFQAMHTKLDAYTRRLRDAASRYLERGDDYGPDEPEDCRETLREILEDPNAPSFDDET